MTKSTPSSKTRAASLARDLERDVIHGYYTRDVTCIKYVLARYFMRIDELLDAQANADQPAQPEGKPSQSE
jgi:hypothetical protein